MATPVQSINAFTVDLTPAEFAWISDFIYTRAGIVMKDGKQTLVTGRLARRLRHHGLSSYSQYFQRLKDPNNPETRVAVDLLTTNETYFFREADHFTFLREVLAQRPSTAQSVRVWSAASSSGEEAYSLAMTLADCLPRTEWEVIGTDISSRVVERAQKGLYPLDAATKIPVPLLRKYCLRGKADYEGYLAVHPALIARVRFQHLNLLEPFPELGSFDVIFLRNVMIYFDLETKRSLVQRVSSLLVPGGYLLVSHSETLNGIQEGLTMLKPSIYRSAAR
jgi:chemotaxis protein methyltransferase CheR